MDAIACDFNRRNALSTGHVILPETSESAPELPIPKLTRKSEIWKIRTSGCPTVRRVRVSVVSIHHALRSRRVHYLRIQ